MHQQALLPDPVAMIPLDLDIVHRLGFGANGKGFDLGRLSVHALQALTFAQVACRHPIIAVYRSELSPFPKSLSL
jgi:hypothetical protein